MLADAENDIGGQVVAGSNPVSPTRVPAARPPLVVDAKHD